jgi:surfeit locus 1 family protein
MSSGSGTTRVSRARANAGPGWRAALALLAAAAAFAGTLALGNWQTRRAEQKLALEAQWEAVERRTPQRIDGLALPALAAQLPARVVLRGRFLHDRTVWLDNRQHGGQPGFWVMTPLQLDGAGTAVLVNRGWAPRNNLQRAELPPIGRPDGELTIEGLALPQAPRLFELGDGSASGPLPAIWQNLDYDAFERISGLAVARLVVQQRSRLDDGLVRDWPRPNAGVDKHRGYALQWYGLAALIAGLTLWFSGRAWWRRSRALPDH